MLPGQLHALRSQLDCTHDMDVTSATAQITAYCFTNLLFSRIRLLLKEVPCGHQHSRGAVAALKSMTFPESLLQNVKVWTRREALHGEDLLILGLNGQKQTRPHRSLSHHDRACAAYSDV